MPRERIVVLHNALHDLPVLRDLGIDLVKEGIPFTDTMVMAYLLGLEPQGLKPLAYRHAGMHQDAYDEITHDAGELIAQQWLLDIVGRLETADAKSDQEKARKLIERMLLKDGTAKNLRQRWADCRAREILEEELDLIGPMPEPTLDDVDPAVAVRYSARDADATRRIFPILDAQIDAMGLRDVLDADIAALPMIDRMQTVGMKVDLPHFRDLSPLLGMEMAEIQSRIDAAAGEHVNPASGDQVAEWLFGRLHLPWKKKTDGGRPSTQDKVLEALRKRDDVSADGKAAIELIQEYREVQKLKGTYCDKIPGFVNPRTGRLHPQLRITRVATGRLSAKAPNLLAFPKHSDRGKMIREGFVAGEGHLLGSWDLSQIEMCVMAIDSGDAHMLAEFRSGIDKHCGTAGLIFGIDPKVLEERVEAKDPAAKEQRFAAKAVNFGILMGITEKGLLDQFHKNGSLDWTEDRCRELLREWHKAYPQASSYIFGKHAEARRYGYVRDMWGRLRYLPGVHSWDRQVQEEALRQAQATPIQSGAQGIEKRLMARIWQRLPQLWELGIFCEPLLQVHDDLIFEFDEEAYLLVDDLIMDALSEIQWFPIPIKAEGNAGRKWSEL